jgi:iron complex outermembrane receptor protein
MVRVVVMLSVLPPAVLAEPDDLTALSIEELMEVEITSVSRSEEPQFEAAAAVYVISAEDIRRSGATHVPDLLRMVPGLQVAQVTSNTWAVSARGFNGVFANKLLVLIDGRSVYTPLFSGVYWDVQDVLLEDIERIEVIRGPGGTLWGANAVNGVISIITKNAADTQGALITGGAGNIERGFGGARWGGAVGTNLHYRGYVKYLDRDRFDDVAGIEPEDQWDMLRGGFRADWTPTVVDSVRFQGDIYQGSVGANREIALPTEPFHETVTESPRIAGGNILGSWDHQFTESASTSLQLYYDRNTRDSVGLREDLDTFDLDFQHQFSLGAHQSVIWGLGYRFTSDDMRDSFGIRLTPRSRDFQLVSGFVQDQIALAEQLRLTLGTKIEHNDFSGVEVQPSGRLLWTPHARHVLWAAVSRAVRTPSRSEHDALLTTFLTIGEASAFFRGSGNRDLEAEDLLAYEAGYRVRPLRRLSLDAAIFYNDYDDIASLPIGPPFLDESFNPPQLVFPAQALNLGSATAYGLELAAEWRPIDRWRLSAGYTWLDLDIDAGADNAVLLANTDENPTHQFNARSYLELPWNLEFDTAAYYVDDLAAFDISEYVRLDLRAGWHATAQLELSVVGQNVNDAGHREFDGGIGTAAPGTVPRSIYGKVTWRF